MSTNSSMRLALVLPALLIILGSTLAAAQTGPGSEEQIAAAVLAAPDERRADATVLGFRDGKIEVLRKGEGDLVCLADDPKAEGFSVACYHESLEPFMARGRELASQGVTGKERRDQRLAEVASGDLAMPRDGRMLYVLSGESYDPATGEIAKRSLRWVIYMPFATAEGTGFSATPKRGEPWLMDGGTAGAHLMITSPQ